MSTRSWCTALVLVATWLGSSPAHADEVAEIEAMYRNGKADLALQQADAEIAKQPRAARIRFLKGVILADMGHRAEAIDVYLALTQDFPELADPYNNLAVLYAATGQLHEALAALQSALRNDPQHLRARENLGDVYLALAIQSWDAASVQSKGEDAKLQRKLHQARDIEPNPAVQSPSRHRR